MHYIFGMLGDDIVANENLLHCAHSLYRVASCFIVYNPKMMVVTAYIHFVNAVYSAAKDYFLSINFNSTTAVYFVSYYPERHQLRIYLQKPSQIGFYHGAVYQMQSVELWMLLCALE